MELGDFTAAERDQRSLMDKALDRFDSALTDVINTVETGGLDRLEADQQVAVWQRFETIRNKLPLVDHRLIAHAAADLPREYCSATMTQFLVRILQLTHGEAAARVRAAAGVGPRTSMLGEQLEPLLPQLAALQRDGVVSAAKVQIVGHRARTGRAASRLPRAGLAHPAGSVQRGLVVPGTGCHTCPLAPPRIVGSHRRRGCISGRRWIRRCRLARLRT